jgi:hypothetical protein
MRRDRRREDYILSQGNEKTKETKAAPHLHFATINIEKMLPNIITRNKKCNQNYCNFVVPLLFLCPSKKISSPIKLYLPETVVNSDFNSETIEATTNSGKMLTYA